MKFAGVIAEYDPFHNGHAAQLSLLRANGAQTIAVCMSSGAVQRGGLPLLQEPVRVRAALEAGADLVIALPAPYACATAQPFAAAGVRLLTALGCDTLAFGAETPAAELLADTARFLRTPALTDALTSALAGGMTSAAARAAAEGRQRTGRRRRTDSCWHPTGTARRCWRFCAAERIFPACAVCLRGWKTAWPQRCALPLTQEPWRTR